MVYIMMKRVCTGVSEDVMSEMNDTETWIVKKKSLGGDPGEQHLSEREQAENKFRSDPEEKNNENQLDWCLVVKVIIVPGVGREWLVVASFCISFFKSWARLGIALVHYIKHITTHGSVSVQPVWGLKAEENKLSLPGCLASVLHII